MTTLSVGDLVLTYDGSAVSCSRSEGEAVSVAVPDDLASGLDFGFVHICLNPVEWRELLGQSGETEVAEIVAAAEETTVPVAAPAPTKRGRRS
jgi:hypothetical protein